MPFVPGQHGLGVTFERRQAFSQSGLVVIGAASGPKTFGHRCDRRGQEYGERYRAGLRAFERFGLSEGPRKPIEEHQGRAFAREASVDELEYETVGDESARFEKRVRLQTEWRAAVNLFT